MLKVRCVYGRLKGQYYSCYDARSPVFNDVGVLLNARDAASIIMGLIDTVRVVAVPEMTEDSTHEECVECADYLCRGMFQEPGDGTKDLVLKRCIRVSAYEPIHEQPACFDGQQDTGYMSVFEWLGRSIKLRSS